MPPLIPDKLYFKIGEAAEIVGVETHVLRFWESEFPQLKPARADSNIRLYRRQDLETFLAIKRLLYEEKFTIPGARKQLAAKAKAASADRPDPDSETLRQVRDGLLEIKSILD